MTSFDVPRNQVQQPGGGVNADTFNSILINKRVIGDLPNGFAYQVPAGKKAIWKNISWVVDAFGNNSVSKLGFLKNIGQVFVQVGFTQELPSPPSPTLIPQVLTVEVVLEALDKVGTDPTGATNAGIDYSFTIEEFDV